MNTKMNAKTRVLSIAQAAYDPAIVCINDQALESIEFPKDGLTAMHSEILQLPAGETAQSAAEYLLILNSLNFRFWDVVEGNFTRYDYKGLVGALGMRKAFAEAWGPQRWSSNFWRNLYKHGVLGLFGNIPAVEDRAIILDELYGLVRCGKFYSITSRIALVAAQMRKFTMEDAEAIAQACPLSYGDSYLKKAQLMLAEYASFYSEVVAPVDCTDFTLFADYQLPRVMRALGLLTYSDALSTKIAQQELVAVDSPEEQAIRAATILAGERLAKRLQCTTAQLDNYLWLNRKKAEGNFHLTPTTNY